jgi:hypothetical protein
MMEKSAIDTLVRDLIQISLHMARASSRARCVAVGGGCGGSTFTYEVSGRRIHILMDQGKLTVSVEPSGVQK